MDKISNDKLMELSNSFKMESIAIGYMDIDSEVIDNIKSDYETSQMRNFVILNYWRENNKEIENEAKVQFSFIIFNT